jgi:small subunit ribosomal protein S1
VSELNPNPEPGQAAPIPAKPPTKQEAPTKDFGPDIQIRNLDKAIENELAAAMGELSERELYGDLSPKANRAVAPAEERKVAKVVAVRGNDVFVTIPGGRSEGVLPLAQFEGASPAPGSSVEVSIEGFDHENGLLIVTRKGAALQVDWSTVETGMVVEARVTATNKGGLSVEVNGIRGFMPVSQIDLYHVENPESFVNQKLKCLVTEADASERNLVVSRRALLEKEREENRERLWAELEEGQDREGIVRNIRDFGAFVDLGGVDALLPISEMSWKRVQNPADIVQSGQTVRVRVLRIDREQRKVSVGMKQLVQSPWDAAGMHYPPKSVHRGKVTRVADFGAFVELEPGIEGLVHISELAAHRVQRVRDVVQPDQEVNVLVLRVEPAQRKMSLSMKAAQTQAPEEPEAEEAAETEKPASRSRKTPLRGGLGD